MVETALLSQWMHNENMNLKYARWKQGRNEGEVDLIQLNSLSQKTLWCLEIKWSNRYVDKPAELKSLLEFCEKNKLTSAIVTTIDKEVQTSINNLRLLYYPAAVYAYSVGANTIKQKTQ